MHNFENGGSIEDPENPGVDITTGESKTLWSGEPILFDDKVNKLTMPGDFIRLCAAVVHEHQYAKFSSTLDGPRRAKYFMLDAMTAGLVMGQWKRMPFRLRRKLIKAIRKRGPIGITCMFWNVTGKQHEGTTGDCSCDSVNLPSRFCRCVVIRPRNVVGDLAFHLYSIRTFLYDDVQLRRVCVAGVLD